jgi:hypothetical protein
MKFEQFNDKHRNLNIRRDELVRKWNIKRFEEEQYRLVESLSNEKGGKANAPSIGSGGSPISSLQSQFLVYEELGASTFTYYVFNYNDGTLNGPHDTGISSETYNFSESSQFIVNKKGFCQRFFNSSTNDFALLFVSATGEIIETIEGNTGDLSVNVLEGRYIVAWDYDLFTMWIFDGEKVYTDSTTVSGTDGYNLVGNNWDDSNSEGFFLTSYTSIDDTQLRKVFQWNGSSFSEIYSMTDATEIGVQFYSWAESNKLLITKINSDTEFYLGFTIIGTSGNVLQDVEFEDSTYSNQDLNRFGSDKFFATYYNSGDADIDYKVYAYDAGEDLLLETTVDRGVYNEFNTYSTNKSQSSYYDFILPENCLIMFYHRTGNYGYGMDELDYCKFVGFFEGESDFVITDFADGENKYTSIYVMYNKNLFLISTEEGGDFSFVKFNSTGILSNHTFEGINPGDATNLENARNGDRIYFKFFDEDNSINYVYMINSDASEFIYLDGELEYVNYDREFDTFIVYDNINQAWYFNSVSTEWTSTNYYNAYNNITSYTSETRLSDGIVSGYTVDRIYYFNDDDNGQPNRISDGGDDMYDTGNIINTDLGTEIPYTHTQMSVDNESNEANISDFIMDGTTIAGDETNFGSGSTYFTNLYPGLFVLSASEVDISEFFISGDLGSYGNGQHEILTYIPTGYESTYTAYIKRLWDTNDPTINQVIIVDTDGTGITHTSDSSNVEDDNSITGLTSVTKLHYLLFAKADGGKVTNAEFEGVINSYLTIVDDKTLSNVLTDLNANYQTIMDNLPSVNNESTLEIYKRDSIQTVSINAYQDLDSGKDVFAIWYYDGDRDNKVTLKMYDYSGTLLHTIETDDETQNSFNVIESGVYLRTSTKYFDGDLYHIHNMYHLSKNKAVNITFTLPDGMNPYQSFNDFVWWDND